MATTQASPVASAGRLAAVPDRLRAAVAAAVFAPSIYNTQPWRFRLQGDALELRADRSRALPVADPDGRQLVISCGAALLTLEVAARHFGLEPAVATLPDPYDADLLARVRAGGPAQYDDGALFEAIPVRHSNRRGFSPRDLPEPLLDSLIAAAGADRAWAYVVTSVADRWVVGGLVEDADRAQLSSPAFRQELTSWIRPPYGGARDGMRGYATGSLDPVTRVRPLLRTVGTGRATGSRDRRCAEESPAIVVLGTTGDGPADWLAAGRALQRLLLRVTVAGVAAAIVNQPLQVPVLRDRLARLVPYDGFPQVAVRLGYPLAAVRGEARRGLDEVLEEVSGLVPAQRPPAD